jgi:hypothetical protein
MVVSDENMIQVRDALKPHRAEVMLNNVYLQSLYR